MICHHGGQPGWHFRRDFDPGQSGADDQYGILPGGARLAAEPSEMRAETHCRFISIDIECVLPQSRDRRPYQSAAEAEDHPIIGKLGWPARRDAADGSTGDREIADVSHHQSDADRIEHIGQRHAGAT